MQHAEVHAMLVESYDPSLNFNQSGLEIQDRSVWKDVEL
jgi:hypothetical protein